MTTAADGLPCRTDWRVLEVAGGQDTREAAAPHGPSAPDPGYMAALGARWSGQALRPDNTIFLRAAAGELTDVDREYLIIDRHALHSHHLFTSPRKGGRRGDERSPGDSGGLPGVQLSSRTTMRLQLIAITRVDRGPCCTPAPPNAPRTPPHPPPCPRSTSTHWASPSPRSPTRPVSRVRSAPSRWTRSTPPASRPSSPCASRVRTARPGGGARRHGRCHLPAAPRRGRRGRDLGERAELRGILEAAEGPTVLYCGAATASAPCSGSPPTRSTGRARRRLAYARAPADRPRAGLQRGRRR